MELDLGLDYTGGIRKPTPDEVGYVAVVDSTGFNLIYIPAGSLGLGGGGGDFSGPGASVDGTPVLFNGTSGKVGKAGPINLAGGSGFVTGVLPVANQTAQNMGGDVTGTTAASTVAKVNGTSYPAGGALTSGQIPRVTGAATVAYGALDLANANAVTGQLPLANVASQAITALSGASNTLALGHANQYLRINNASATSLTVPANSSVAFAVGTRIAGIQIGAGQVTIVAAGGVTINTPETLLLRKQWSSFELRKVATDEWDLSGDVQLA